MKSLFLSNFFTLSTTLFWRSTFSIIFLPISCFKRVCPPKSKTLFPAALILNLPKPKLVESCSIILFCFNNSALGPTFLKSLIMFLYLLSNWDFKLLISSGMGVTLINCSGLIFLISFKALKEREWSNWKLKPNISLNWLFMPT